jgi:serine/threonine protein kinase
MNAYLIKYYGIHQYTIPTRLVAFINQEECGIVAAWYVLITQSTHRHISLTNIRSKIAPSCKWSDIGHMMELLFNINPSIQDVSSQLSAIGKGNMSVVLSHMDGKLIAVKQQLFYRGPWEVSSHMVHECNALQQIRNNAWAPVIIFQNMSRDMLQLGMEYIPLSVKQLIRLGSRNIQFIRTIMKQLITAVYELHFLGLVHRDIKPDNMRFRSDGTLVLIDYDSCEPHDGPHAYKTSHVCTSLYRDPYLFIPDVDLSNYSYTSLDAFSCGAVFLYMLLGCKHAFNGNDDTEIYENMIRYVRDDVVGLGSHISNTLTVVDHELLRGLLKCDPTRRLTITDAYTLIQSKATKL